MAIKAVKAVQTQKIDKTEKAINKIADKAFMAIVGAMHTLGLSQEDAAKITKIIGNKSDVDVAIKRAAAKANVKKARKSK